MAQPALSARQTAQVSARLRQLREERGWSMRKLATLAGISSGTVSELEHRVIQPTLATMLILQQVFELSSIEELLGELPDTPRLPSAELGALSNRAIRSA